MPRDTLDPLSSRVLLNPSDLDRSLRFYGETLGLAVYREWGSGDHRGIVFFLGGGGLLELSGTGSGAVSAAIKLVLQVRDIQATHELLKARSVTIDAAPELKPWGLIEFIARDPDGLELIFAEIPADHPRRRG